MQNSSILATSTIVSNTTVSNETNTTPPTITNSASISTTCNQKQSEHETTHDLCLDDLLKESYEKLMKSNENEIQLLPQIVGDNAFENNTGVMTFENSSMSTNYTSINNNFNTNYHSTLETICEDSIKELLYGHVG